MKLIYNNLLFVLLYFSSKYFPPFNRITKHVSYLSLFIFDILLTFINKNYQSLVHIFQYIYYEEMLVKVKRRTVFHLIACDSITFKYLILLYMDLHLSRFPGLTNVRCKSDGKSCSEGRGHFYFY